VTGKRGGKEKRYYKKRALSLHHLPFPGVVKNPRKKEKNRSREKKNGKVVAPKKNPALSTREVKKK